jgi:hypothetical protein
MSSGVRLGFSSNADIGPPGAREMRKKTMMLMRMSKGMEYSNRLRMY